mgnify:CR=1 FL=1
MKLGHKIIYIFLPIFILLKINISFSQEKKLNVLPKNEPIANSNDVFEVISKALSQ